MSDYEFVNRGSLKLKTKDSLGVSAKSKSKLKKKKKKVQQDERHEQSNDTSNQQVINETNEAKPVSTEPDNNTKKMWMTKAEKKFLEQQEKRQLARVMAKASKSHKQRVEEFNNYLGMFSYKKY